jgi:hypothetical protein
MVIDRPPAAVVQRARSGQPAQSLPKLTVRVGSSAGVPGRAGEGAGLLVDGEVVEGVPARNGRSQRLGLDHGVVPTGTVGGTGCSDAIGGVAVGLQARALLVSQASVSVWW